MIEAVKLEVRGSDGSLYRYPVELEYEGGRITFVKSPFALKDEIKAMSGSKWNADEKCWSVKDCPRNRFQLAYLSGEDVYAWFDRDLIRHKYVRPLREHQKDLCDHGLTYKRVIWAAGMGVGKSLCAQEIIERCGHELCFWVGPKTTLPNMEREFQKWDYSGAAEIVWLTYDGLKKAVASLDEVPGIVIFDEASRLKNKDAQRSVAAQQLADAIRETHGDDAYIIAMSGTPSPKSPIDWWSLCEIVWPGFLREGSPKALEQRLAILSLDEADGRIFNRRVAWRDDERKCNVCAEFKDDHDDDTHFFVPSKNEVAYLSERLQGLVVVKHKKDCLDLPEKQYNIIRCKPSDSLLRAAAVIAKSSPNAITAATRLRELSDGFMYHEEVDGVTKCRACNDGVMEEWFDPDDGERTFEALDMLDPELTARLQKREIPCRKCGGSLETPNVVRTAQEIPCPKDDVLLQQLERCEETGRIVIFAGFTASLDRIVRLCKKEAWEVVRCDGSGFQAIGHSAKPLDYWCDRSNERVAFVAHPESGGFGLTLTESSMAFFWSNDFKAENRTQAEDRIHRLGMDETRGAEIVDVFHLPSDERVYDVVRNNRRLELMTLGDFAGDLL